MEHHRCLRSRLITKSSAAEHQLETGHQILLDSTSAVALSRYYVAKKIRGINKKHSNNINREAGFPLQSTRNTVYVFLLYNKYSSFYRAFGEEFLKWFKPKRQNNLFNAPHVFQ